MDQPDQPDHPRLTAVEALRRLGGVAAYDALLALTTRRRLRSALERREVVRVAQSRYALVDARGQRRIAAELSGVLSHLGAAQHHGWPVKQPPEEAWVTVPRHRKVGRRDQARAQVVWADLTDGEVGDGVTAALRTVLDCARRLAFDEALTVADSALRAGAVTAEQLTTAAAGLRGPGAGRARRVAGHADARSAGPFESVLRALVVEDGTLDVVPQLAVATRGMTYHPDLVDVARRVVIEADSWGFHGDHLTHGRDCVRHTALAVAGWRVPRFSWEQVMLSAPYVRAVLADLAADLG